MPSYDPETQILKILCRYELIQDNKIQKTEDEDFCVRLYRDHEMDEWVKETGFKNVVQYTSYDRTLSRDPELIIYECVK